MKEIRLIDKARIEFLAAVTDYEQIERRARRTFQKRRRGGQRVGSEASRCRVAMEARYAPRVHNELSIFHRSIRER